jgi:prolipoprotein diacylglyceryl transferase
MSLPKLHWDFDPIFFTIPLPGGGGHPISYYGVLFLIALIAGYALFEWQVKRGGGTEKDAGDFLWYTVVAVFVGARLGHALFYEFDKAIADPLWILRVWKGGLASHGAVVGLVVAMYVFTRRRGVSFLEGFDRFAISATLAVVLVRVGNFLNSEIVGRHTDQTWGVEFVRHAPDRLLDAVPFRHPAQLYEAALGLGLLVALIVADRAWGKEKRPRGALVSLGALGYFTGRFLLEFVKEYQTLEAGSLLTMGQWLSRPCVLVSGAGLVWSLRQRLPAGWHAASG